MGINDLIDFMQRFDREGYTQRDPRVQEAMSKIDRKSFLEASIIQILEVDPKRLLDTFETYRKAVEGGQVNLPPDLKKALNNLFSNYRVFITEISGLAYSDHPLNIGDGQTCSQPSLVALMADALELREGLSVLEGGTGTGYHAAVTSYLIGESGRLVSVEINPRLAQLAIKNLKTYFGDVFEPRIRVIQGDIMQFLEVGHEYFDRIYFTAAVDLDTFDLGKLVKRLRDGNGIILLPEKKENLIWQIYENGVKVRERNYEGYTFVPLLGKSS